MEIILREDEIPSDLLEYFEPLPESPLSDVFKIPTEPFAGSHFATFPKRLVEVCVMAGTSEAGCCPVCGKPWERVVERQSNYGRREAAHAPNSEPSKVDSSEWRPPTVIDRGLRPSCKCDAGDPVPCVVLDPFAGSGTTLLRSKQIGRRSVGIELSEAYCELAARRLGGQMTIDGELFRGEVAVG